MAKLFDMFKKDMEESPPPVFRYELYGKSKNREPMYAWINMDTSEWVQDDFKGKMLPKGAVKEYGTSIKKYQKELLDKGQMLPQNPTPPVQMNKDTKERNMLKKIFEYIKGS